MFHRASIGIPALREVPLFQALDDDQIGQISVLLKERRYHKGDTVFHQGDPGDAAYVILAGKADILTESPNGQIKVAELDYNTIVGEIAIICNTARTATVKATMPLEALRIRKDDFLKLLVDYPEMTIEIMRVLADRLSRTTTELAEARSLVERIN